MSADVPHLRAVIRCGLHWCGIFMLFASAALGAEKEKSAPVFRKVIVRVVDESGAPIAGVKVQLLGTGRDALQAMDIDSKENVPGVWNFVSDAQGRCTVRFGCFSGYDSDKLAGKRMPGWGAFYFIAESDGLRGVSACVSHDSPEWDETKGTHDEWTRRGIVRTSRHPVALTLRMRRGLRVEGRVIDMAGRPVADFGVSIEHDLHSTHHTGYGDEIFKATTSSDAEGRFTFEHVFPNTFYLLAFINEERLPVWVKTRLRGKWVAEPVDRITPRKGEKVIGLTLEVSPTMPYRYYGQVTDQGGRPVAGAAMAFGISRHRHPRTYGDFHHTLRTKTDDAGRYELLTATPFIQWAKVTADGFKENMEGDFSGKDENRAPGKWDFILRRQ